MQSSNENKKQEPVSPNKIEQIEKKDNYLITQIFYNLFKKNI